jgi:hypothetical protein
LAKKKDKKWATSTKTVPIYRMITKTAIKKYKEH